MGILFKAGSLTIELESYSCITKANRFAPNPSYNMLSQPSIMQYYIITLI